jgi:hypothetical protein
VRVGLWSMLLERQRGGCVGLLRMRHNWRRAGQGLHDVDALLERQSPAALTLAITAMTIPCVTLGTCKLTAMPSQMLSSSCLWRRLPDVTAARRLAAPELSRQPM